MTTTMMMSDDGGVTDGAVAWAAFNLVKQMIDEGAIVKQRRDRLTHPDAPVEKVRPPPPEAPLSIAHNRPVPKDREKVAASKLEATLRLNSALQAYQEEMKPVIKAMPRRKRARAARKLVTLIEPVLAAALGYGRTYDRFREGELPEHVLKNVEGLARKPESEQAQRSAAALRRFAERSRKERAG